MIIDGKNVSPMFRIISITGRGVFDRELITVKAIGSEYEYVTNREINSREIDVLIDVRAKTSKELRKKIDDVSAFLNWEGYKPVVFSDEPDMTYYAEYEGYEEVIEHYHAHIHRGVIKLLVQPNKLKDEETIDVKDGMAIVKNEGNELTEPVIELTAKQKVTYAMVENGIDEYNLIGYPLEEGSDEVVNERELIFKETGTTFNSWLNSPQVFDSNFSIANGSLTADPTGIYANNYGSSTTKNHGGFKVKELPESIQDFRVETHFDVDTPNDDETFRIEVYMIADDLSIIGKLGMLDGSSSVKRRVGLARVGPFDGHGKNYTHYSGNYNQERVGSSQTWYLRMIREGDLIKTRIARRLRGEQVRGRNGSIYTYDISNAKKPLKYIGVYIGYYKETRRPRLARVNHIDVYKLNKVREDQTPYILGVGDTVTFDHDLEEVLINGEDAMMLKHFGADFWRLFPGNNTVMISPPGAFDATIKFKEKYK